MDELVLLDDRRTLTVGDMLDEDEEAAVCLETFESEITFYLSGSQAEDLISHLQVVFDLQ